MVKVINYGFVMIVLGLDCIVVGILKDGEMMGF